MKKGSLVKFVGKNRVIQTGAYLSVYDAKGDSATVWLPSGTGKWVKRKVPTSDLELVVDPPEG